MISLPRVSVLMPTYNASEFIEEAIKSVIDQTYENIELVICDDASTDDTKDQLVKFHRAYPDRITLLINEENIGITRNCNKILDACTGKYICFFAGDDIMLPDKISAQVAVLESDVEASMCYHRVEIFDSETKGTISITESTRTIYSFFDIIEKIGLPGANSIMARRSCLPPDGYNVLIPAVSDWLFFIEIALRGKILFLNASYAKYRKHCGGASNRTNELLQETLYTLEIIKRRYAGDYRINAACKKARFRYLAGELARLIKINDVDRIKNLNLQYIRKDFLALGAAISLYIKSGVYKLNIGALIYSIMKYIKN
jgi:glycosyltransferase involved in cell wall biosynthesis